MGRLSHMQHPSQVGASCHASGSPPRYWRTAQTSICTNPTRCDIVSPLFLPELDNEPGSLGHWMPALSLPSCHTMPGFGLDKLSEIRCYAAASIEPPCSPRQGGCGGCSADSSGFSQKDTWFQREMAWVLRPQHPPVGFEPRLGRQRIGRPCQSMPVISTIASDTCHECYIMSQSQFVKVSSVLAGH